MCLSGHPDDADAVRAAMGGETHSHPADVTSSPHVARPGEGALTIWRGAPDVKGLDDLRVQFGTGEAAGVAVAYCSVLAVGATPLSALEALAPVIERGTLVTVQEPERFEIVPRANIAWLIESPPGYPGVALLSLRTLVNDLSDLDCMPVDLSIEAADGLDLALGLAHEALDPARIAARREFEAVMERAEALRRELEK